MSTKNVDQTQTSFDPTSMSTFNAFQPTYRSGMLDLAQNPMQSSFFNTQMQMQNAQNRAYFSGIRNQQNQNMAAGGYVGNMPAFMQDQNLNISRGLSAANSNTFNNLLLGTNQLRIGALQNMGRFSPLQTGQTQTKTQSGLGTWLPQVAGMGLGLAGMAMTGGAAMPLMMMGQGMGSQAAKGMTGAPQTVDPSSYDPGNPFLSQSAPQGVF